jgi:F-type H+-transporting ATPase subunit c
MEATAFIPLGMGAAVIGAGLGIGKLAAAAAESIARQPEAASEITAAVNLPLFLLEGVAIIALALTFAMLLIT